MTNPPCRWHSWELLVGPSWRKLGYGERTFEKPVILGPPLSPLQRPWPPPPLLPSLSFSYFSPLPHISHPLLPGHHKVMVLCPIPLSTTDLIDPKWWSHRDPCPKPQVIEPSDYRLKHLRPLGKSHFSSMNSVHLQHSVTATEKLTDSSGLSRNSPCSFRRLWEAKNEHCLCKDYLVGALWL